jgi:hypothetical protein
MRNTGTDYANIRKPLLKLMFLSEKKVAPKQVQQLLFCVTTEKQVFGVADFVERLTGDY